MKLDPHLVRHRRITTLSSSGLPVIRPERSNGLDVMVSLLLALLVAAIALDDPISSEIMGAGADRQSYFASAVDFIVNVGLSIGLTWVLFSSRPRENDERTGL